MPVILQGGTCRVPRSLSYVYHLVIDPVSPAAVPGFYLATSSSGKNSGWWWIYGEHMELEPWTV